MTTSSDAGANGHGGAADARRRAPAGSPNVVVILLDDTGFGQLGCYGSDIATPTFDRLAAAGAIRTALKTD